MDNENIALRFEMKDDDAKDDMTEVNDLFFFVDSNELF
jgi:hypothetical protein